MRRIYLRTLIVALVLVALPALFIRVGTRQVVESVDIADFRDQAAKDLLQRIRDFHRVVTRNGERLLEVSAKEASYFRDERGIEIIEPNLIFYDDGEKAGWISGDRGELIIEGNDVETVEMLGDVQLTLAQFEVTSTRLIYERVANIITAPGYAEIRSPELVLKGEGLTLDLDSRTLRVDAEVDMTLHKSGGDADVSAATSEVEEASAAAAAARALSRLAEVLP